MKAKAKPLQSFQIPQKRLQQMQRLKDRAEQLKAKARETMELRSTPAYHKAMAILAQDLGTAEAIPNLKLTLTLAIVESIGACD